MKPSSAKAKGRRLQDWIVKTVHRYFPSLREGDVRGAIMGESGKDIVLSPLAADVIPFDIEAKNQERLNVWAALEQAESNCDLTCRVPVVIFKRNRSETYAALPAERLFELLATLRDYEQQFLLMDAEASPWQPEG